MEMKKKLNADKIYKHYGIARPTYRCQPKDVLKALLEIKKNNEISNKYCDPIIDFLQQKRISIEDIVYYDLISKIFQNSNEIKAILRKIFYLLCSKYKVLNLALELCIVPDLSNGYCDYNNPKSLEAGLGEAYLGIYPYSIITTNVRPQKSVYLII